MIAHGVLLNSFITTTDDYAGLFSMLWDIMYIPYFQIYGELFMEDIKNEKDQIYDFKMYNETCAGTAHDCCFLGTERSRNNLNDFILEDNGDNKLGFKIMRRNYKKCIYWTSNF